MAVRKKPELRKCRPATVTGKTARMLEAQLGIEPGYTDLQSIFAVQAHRENTVYPVQFPEHTDSGKPVVCQKIPTLFPRHLVQRVGQILRAEM